MKEVSNKIVINQAGEDRIVLAQKTDGFWYCKELNHTCKSIELGLDYLLSHRDRVKNLLKQYNLEEK